MSLNGVEENGDMFHTHVRLENLIVGSIEVRTLGCLISLLSLHAQPWQDAAERFYCSFMNLKFHPPICKKFCFR